MLGVPYTARADGDYLAGTQKVSVGELGGVGLRSPVAETTRDSNMTPLSSVSGTPSPMFPDNQLGLEQPESPSEPEAPAEAVPPSTEEPAPAVQTPPPPRAPPNNYWKSFVRNECMQNSSSAYRLTFFFQLS